MAEIIARTIQVYSDILIFTYLGNCAYEQCYRSPYGYTNAAQMVEGSISDLENIFNLLLPFMNGDLVTPRPESRAIVISPRFFVLMGTRRKSRDSI